MGNHVWVLPWITIGIGAISSIAGYVLALPERGVEQRSISRIPVGHSIVWLLVTVAAIVVSLRTGSATGLDYIAARGLLLGSVGGVVLALSSRHSASPSVWAAQLGLASVLTGIGRLWLTHGEVTGLVTLVIGASISLICFALAPAILSDVRPVPGNFSIGAQALLFLSVMAASAIIGFTRAESLDEPYWADIPLIFGSVLSLACVVVALRRRDNPFAERSRTEGRWDQSLIVIFGLAMALITSLLAGHDWSILGLFVMGLALAWLASLSFGGDNTPIGEAGGAALIIAGLSLAQALGSGYGLVLVAIGGWFGCSRLFLTSERPQWRPWRIMAFTALILVYRVAMLSARHAVRTEGPGDIWDLFAIGLGIVLPALCVSWSLGENDGPSSRPSIGLASWLIAAIVAGGALAYIWQPRSLAGVFLGLAIGELFAWRNRDVDAWLEQGRTVTALVFGSGLLWFFPIVAHWSEPTRHVRVAVIAALAVIVAVRLLVGYRSSQPTFPSAATAGGKG